MRYKRMAAFLITAGVSLAASVSDSAQKLVCSQPVYDFGEAPYRANIRRTFILKNEGDLPLEIKQILPDQGCAVSPVSQTRLAPGEETRLSVEFPLYGRSGPQLKTITVESDDPEQPKMTLTLKGTAVEEVVIDPPQLEFRVLQTGSAATGTVRVALYTGHSFTIGKIECSHPQVAARSEVVEEGKSYRIIVTTRPPLPPGSLRSGVRIETDDPRHPSLNVSVSGIVTAD